jgi:hypothetical protein
MIDGETVIEDGEIRTLDETHIYSRAEEEGRDLQRKLGRLGPDSSHVDTSPWKLE